MISQKKERLIQYKHQTRNLSNVLHEQDSQFFQLCPRKTRKSRHFWQQIWNEDASLIYFKQIVSSFAIIYSNTTSVHLFCDNYSSQTLANFTELVIFALILPEPKTFYTSATCITFDKFHVCDFLKMGLHLNQINISIKNKQF